MKKISMNKELVDIIVVMAWLLIGIIVGLAIGTLVSFIKFIVTVSTKGPSY